MSPEYLKLYFSFLSKTYIFNVQSSTKQWRQSREVKQNWFFSEIILDEIFRNFLAQLSKFSLQVSSIVLAFNSKHFRAFLEVSSFLKILYVIGRSATHDAIRTVATWS